MFYSADPERGSRKIDTIVRPDDPAWWHRVPVTTGVELFFAILNEYTDPIGRIIAALTGSPAYHVELWIDPSLAAAATTELAESKLGQPYDWERALASWKDANKPEPDGKEFCSGMAYEILAPILQGLEPYPSPGKLLCQVTGMLSLPMPTWAELPAKPTDDDLDWLQSQVPDKIATGTFQEIIASLT